MFNTSGFIKQKDFKKMTDCCNGSPELPPTCSTLVELLRYRALQQPVQLAFTFLEDGETESASLTYRELERYSRAIAAQLQSLGIVGERALLLYPPGLDYIAAFWGCLYAGVIAVPAYPPRNQRNTPRILAMVADAQAAIALTTTAILPKVRSLLTAKTDSEFRQWLTTDNLAAGIEDSWQAPLIEQDTLAFLQYTSGSTDTPKGVMLSHSNLLHNAAATYQLMEHSSASKFVSWLPAYHDMGLIGGILQPLYGGFPCILMPPAAFLQRPYRWLRAISHYRGTTSGGPNFAYELCIQKITPDQRQTLDLSSWSVAFNGAEPVRQETLERFFLAFAPCGFRQEVFYPCYGLAEATLMVTGSCKAKPAIAKTIQGSALERNQIVDAYARETDSQTLVSCGQTLPEQQIVIAHPETLTRCLPNEVGEIWVSGPSIGHGYWYRPNETAHTFKAYLSDTDEGPFLRTGDLGFLHNGELFITGRAKDLIIIRGRNLYPQDIELTVERNHSALRTGGGVAFSVEVGNEERLVVVQEVEFRQQPNIEEVAGVIRQAVAEAHEAQVYAVVLIKPGSILKTSSGKIQRRACRAAFLANTLDVLGSSVLDTTDAVANESHLNREVLLTASAEQRQPLLIAYLQQQVAQVLKIAPSQVNCDRPLSTFGLDSLRAFDFKNRLESDLGIVVSVVDLFQNASIAQLATQVLEQLTDAVHLEPVLQPIPRHQPLPLGLAQERLWFLNQLEPDNPFYNVAIAVQLVGQLNTATLEQSLNEVIRRHEALRTSFSDIAGRPIQAIHPALQVTLLVVDCTTIQNSNSKIQNCILEEVQQPFDLSQVPLLRAKLLRLQQEEHLLLLTLHHIISDGWSIGVLIRELAVLYEAFSSGQRSSRGEATPTPLPELSIQYADFADWQRQWLQGEVLETQLGYWQQQLGSILPVLQLPTDRPRPAIQTFRGAKQSLAFPKALTEALKDLNQQEGVTLFMSLLAVFKTLLYCYTNQTNILVGSPVAGRTKAETEGLIGFFINTLVLRTDLSGNPSFQELLKRVRKVALGAYAHQALPFEKLVEELQPQRNLSFNPLFQVMFILQNTPIPAVITLPGLTMAPLEVDSGTSKFDLKLSLWESSEGLNGSLEYKTDLFDATTITCMASHFERLLHQVVTQPDIRLNELATILAEADNQQQHLQARQLEAASLQKLKLTRRKAIRAL